MLVAFNILHERQVKKVSLAIASCVMGRLRTLVRVRIPENPQARLSRGKREAGEFPLAN